MPPNTKKCDHKEIGYVSNGGSGLHPVPVCKNCNASVFFKPTPTTEKEKCDCLHSHLACQYNNPPCHTPAVEDWEEATRKFANRLAMQLKPSNDTMAAIRLLHKELPSLIASLRESDRKRIIEEIENKMGELKSPQFPNTLGEANRKLGTELTDWNAVVMCRRVAINTLSDILTFITNLK